MVAPCEGRRGRDERESAAAEAVNPLVLTSASEAAPYVDVSALSDEHLMVQLLALRCWRASLGARDLAFLQSSSVFTNLKAVMGGVEDAAESKSVEDPATAR